MACQSIAERRLESCGGEAVSSTSRTFLVSWSLYLYLQLSLHQDLPPRLAGLYQALVAEFHGRNCSGETRTMTLEI